MLPDNAFLRNVPRILDVKQRLAFEVLLIASDAISIAFERLKVSLRCVAVAENRMISDIDRTQIGMDCWTIVDNIHAFFQVAKTLDMKGLFQIEKIGKYRLDVACMRNGMDHIHQNLGNLSRSKGVKMPIYGNVTFTCPKSFDGSFEVVSLAIGGIQFEGNVSGVFDTRAIALVDDIGNITFEAFDRRVELGEMVTFLNEVIKSIDEKFKDEFNLKVIEFANTQECDVSALLQETVRGTIVVRLVCMPVAADESNA